MTFRLERQFPEVSDFDKNKWWHSYHATEEMMRNFELDLDEPWNKNLPTLVYQLGIAQSYIPQSVAVDEKLFSNGTFDFLTGIQNNPVVQDLFIRPHNIPGGAPPICPALLMQPDALDGTAAPSYEGTERPTQGRTSNNIRDQAHAARMRQSFKSTRNQPNVGEFNNGMATMIVEPNPRVKTRYQAVIYVMSEARTRAGCTRNPMHEGTRFDVRNDPASHFKSNQAFQVLEIVKTGDIPTTVNTVEELQIFDQGQLLTQEWLNHHLKVLNGNVTLGNFSTRTKISKSGQNQRRITKNRPSRKPGSVPEDILRQAFKTNNVDHD